MTDRQLMQQALEAQIHKAGMNPVMQGECYLMHPEALQKLIEVAIREALAEQPVQHVHTYASTQATKCAGCGEHKHTPLRIDAMGGYVCLTCIDQKLGSLLGEFGYPEPEQPAQKELVAWRELCRRLYVELFHCDQQMMATRDEEGDPMWQQGATVRDVLADAKAALETPPQPAQQQEPVAFIDMREWPPIRWRDGMVRKDVARFDGQGLFFSPPAQRKPLTDEQVWDAYMKISAEFDCNVIDLVEFARAIEAAHGIKDKNA